MGRMPMAKPEIFINYRREDSIGHAGRLYDRLAERFGKGRVYRDIDDIEVGVDYLEAICQKVDRSDVLLALIGPRWLTATDDEGRRRLADEHDLVRLEIATALNRNIRVIPVLVQGAMMPRSKDLPSELVKLSQLNAVEIRDTHFDQDLAQLLGALAPSWLHHPARILRRRSVTAVAVGLLAAALVAAVYFSQLTLTPGQARLKIGQMGLAYDADTFVERAQNNDPGAVELFLKAGMNPDARAQNRDTALERAATAGHIKVARMLVDKGADVSSALLRAADTGHADMVNFLLSRKPSKKAINEALAVAGNGPIGLVQTLIDSGANVNGDWGGQTPLMSAAYSANIDVVQLLLSQGANVHAAHKNGETPLHYAIRASSGNSIDIVRALLQKGADVNAPDSEGTTPLMKAIMAFNNPELALLLLEHNADATARTKDHVTALMYAAGNNRASLVGPLVSRGADINAENDRGETALMWATGAVDNTRKPEVVRALLMNGANVNAVDRNGWTPLMFAVLHDNADVARILMGRGADPHARNKDGRTALMIATSPGHKESAKVLSEGRIDVRRK